MGADQTPKLEPDEKLQAAAMSKTYRSNQVSLLAVDSAAGILTLLFKSHMAAMGES